MVLGPLTPVIPRRDRVWPQRITAGLAPGWESGPDPASPAPSCMGSRSLDLSDLTLPSYFRRRDLFFGTVYLLLGPASLKQLVF